MNLIKIGSCSICVAKSCRAAGGADGSTPEHASKVEAGFDVYDEELLAVLLQNFGG